MNANKLLLIFIILLSVFVYYRTKENEAPKPYEYATSNFKMHSPNYAEKIPEEVYANTQGNDELFQVINSNRKIIYYPYSNNSEGNSIKRNIQAGLDKEQLNSYYNYYPDLQVPPHLIKCKNKTDKCAFVYLYNNCSDKICIIHPKRKEIVKINNDDFARFMRRAIRLKNW